jgi:hypothetical protein
MRITTQGIYCNTASLRNIVFVTKNIFLLFAFTAIAWICNENMSMWWILIYTPSTLTSDDLVQILNWALYVYIMVFCVNNTDSVTALFMIHIVQNLK